MSEYIVKGAEPNETVLHTRTPNGYEEWRWLPVREEIVRCRDCVSCYRDEYGMWCCLYGTGFYRSPRYEGDYCSRGKRRDA